MDMEDYRWSRYCEENPDRFVLTEDDDGKLVVFDTMLQKVGYVFKEACYDEKRIL